MYKDFFTAGTSIVLFKSECLIGVEENIVKMGRIALKICLNQCSLIKGHASLKEVLEFLFELLDSVPESFGI